MPFNGNVWSMAVFDYARCLPFHFQTSNILRSASSISDLPGPCASYFRLAAGRVVPVIPGYFVVLRRKKRYVKCSIVIHKGVLSMSLDEFTAFPFDEQNRAQRNEVEPTPTGEKWSEALANYIGAPTSRFSMMEVFGFTNAEVALRLIALVAPSPPSSPGVETTGLQFTTAPPAALPFPFFPPFPPAAMSPLPSPFFRAAMSPLPSPFFPPAAPAAPAAMSPLPLPRPTYVPLTPITPSSMSQHIGLFLLIVSYMRHSRFALQEICLGASLTNPVRP